jgi:hypothetical protein
MRGHRAHFDWAVTPRAPVSRPYPKRSTCTESETVKSIMKQMTACKLRHVPVVEQERLVGIVSIGDVVKHTLMEMRNESDARLHPNGLAIASELTGYRCFSDGARVEKEVRRRDAIFCLAEK